jgi:hypothetical protein
LLKVPRGDADALDDVLHPHVGQPALLGQFEGGQA